MKYLVLSMIAMTSLSAVAVGVSSSPAFAGEASALSDRAQMLVGEWTQGVDRTIGEGDEAILISNAWEDVRADGTSSAKMTLRLLGPGVPEAMRTYDISIENNWSLVGDEYVTKVTQVVATPLNDSAPTRNVAEMMETNFMKPTEPMIIVSLNANNYVAQATDGTLISMKRK